MAIPLDELNQAVDWANTSEGARKSPTPVIPPSDSKIKSVSLDEANAFSEHIVTSRDAPKGFWQRRLSDAQVAFDQTPHAVGSALIFLGDTFRGKDAAPVDVTADEPFLQNFEAELNQAVRKDSMRVSVPGYTGTIDLANRPVVNNADGSFSTEKSFSFQDEKTGKEILIPSIINGKEVSRDEAIGHYYETGEHLGVFANAVEADQMAERIHNRKSKGVGKNFRDLIGTSFIKMGFSWQDLSEKLAAEHSKGAEPTSTADEYLSDLTKMGAGMAGLIGIGLVAGPAVATGSFVAPTTFDTYAKARLKGKNYDDAVKIAGAMGIATGTAAFIGLGAILKLQGPLIQQMVQASVIGGIDMVVIRGSSEAVERISGLTESQKKGWDSVSEAVGLAVRDGSMGAILGPATGGVSFAMQKRLEVQEKFKSIGLSDSQAVQTTDALFNKGMNEVLTTVEREHALISNKIFRSEDGRFVDAEGRPVAPERVIATQIKSDIESLPLVERAKIIAAEALPQRETIGVTKEEKAFFGPESIKPSELSKNIAGILFDKFLKIEAKLKQPEAKIKRQIQAVQKELQDFIQESNLEPKDKAKFISDFKNTQTVQQLRRKLPELREKIADLKERVDLKTQIERFQKLTQESVVKKTRPEFQKDIRAISSALSPTKLSVPKVMKLDSLVSHLQNEPNSIIPQYKLEELEALNKKSLRDMTSQDVQLINDAIEHLYKLNELKSNILEKNKYVSLDKTVTEVVTNIKTGSVKKISETDIQSGLETPISKLNRAKDFFGLDSRDTETNLILVEGQDGGIFQSVIFGGMNRGKTDYLRFVAEGQKILREGIKNVDVTNWSQYIQADPKKLDMLTFEFGGGEGRKSKTVEMTKAQALAFHLLMQREEGSNHILNGGISFRGKLSEVIRITSEDAAAVSEAVLSDPQMVKVAANLDAYFNGFQKHAINSVTRRLTGLEIAQTPNYFRIKVNPLYRKTPPELQKYVGKVAIEGMGFLKETVPSKLPIILEDAFQVAYESLHLAGSYVAYAEPIRAAKEVLTDGRVRQEMDRQGRGEFLKSFERYIQRVEGEITDLSNVEALSRDLLVKIQTSILMLNPGILLKQFPSLLSAMTEVNAKTLLRNYRLAATKAEIAEIQDWSPQLAARWQGHISRELGELKNVGAISNLFTGKVGWADKFMTAYQVADHPMVTTVWRAAKEEVTQTNPALTGAKYFEKVAKRAEFIVRRTQASVFVEHRSENLAKRDMFTRSITLFSSETNKQFNMVVRAVDEFTRGKKTSADLTKLGGKLFVISYLNSVLMATINAGINVWKQSPDQGRKDEKKKDFELIAKKFYTDVVLGPLGMIYGVRDMANVIQNVLVYGDVTHEVNNPVTSLVTDLAKGVGNLIQSGEQFVSGEKFKSGSKKNKEKWTETLKSAIIQLVSSIGSAAGLPVSNILRYGEPMFAEVFKFFGE